MDSFHISTFKVEKARAFQRSNISKIASFFRVIELCIVLALILRLSTQVTATVKNSGEYFRGLKVVLVSPIFVFVLGNMIVVILLAKPRKLLAHDSAMKMDRFYEECAEKSRIGQNQEADAHRRNETYRKIRSEKFSQKKDQKLTRALHQSKSEKCMKSFDPGEKSERAAFCEDAMSNEEFRRTIEEFIARQQKFRMEEEHIAN
ncbi:hypothetical protein CRG98_010366 [Punica granatum]|uniref:DUF4408 domain-containing protein n=1 Tax=Punica granatum TaxID=22663 RepID=A0A2I0KLA2_PUNGR|nr:hypothetical protein CRG98_010366 [Punica granatum]